METIDPEVERIINEINKLLNNRSSILTMDFSHFVPINSTTPRLFDVFIRVYGFDKGLVDKYVEISQIGGTVSEWHSFPKNSNKYINYLDQDCSPNDIPIYEHPLIIHRNQKKDTDNPPTEVIINLLKDNAFGSCIFFQTEDVADAQSVVYLTLSKKIDDTDTITDITDFSSVPGKISSMLKEILNYEMIRHFVIDIQLYKQGLIKHATRASISQVLARTMSHNQGAHVFSKLKHAEDIKRLFNVDQYQPFEKPINREEPIFKNKEFQIAYFNEYLKNRMEFLADVATSEPVMQTPKRFYTEIFRDFNKSKVLLDRISGVSGTQRYTFNLYHENYKLFSNNYSYERFIAEEFSVAMPNDVLGCQAFYIILENIIRNIYKHGKIEENNTVKSIPPNGTSNDSNRLNPSLIISVKINKCDFNPAYYEVQIYDNVKKEQAVIDEIVEKRNRSFVEPINDPKTQQLRSKDLGTIEMKACAAYIRGMPILSIEDNKYRVNDNGFCSDGSNVKIPNIIRAYSHSHTDGKYSLGYKLYFSIPHEVLVLDKQKKLKITSCDNLESEGINVISDIDSAQIYNHPCLVNCDDKDIEENKKALLPRRIVQLKNYDFTTAKAFIEKCWISHAHHLMEKHSIRKFEFYNSQRCPGCEEFSSFDGVSTDKNQTQGNIRKIFIANHDDNYSQYGKNNEFYYDMACSHSTITKWEDNIHSNNYTIIAQYIEAILTRIVIIDERIQENLINRGITVKTIPLADYLQRQNVYIPTKGDVDLNSVNFGESNKENSTAAKVWKYLTKKLDGWDYCVIHLGLLQKMRRRASNDNRETTVTTIIETIIPPEHKRKLILTSGTVPTNMPPDVPFVHLSSIQNAIETCYDKILLTKILYGARKPENLMET